MKIRIDVTKRIAIAHVRDFCACCDCHECPSNLYCADLKERGLLHFEELEPYQLQTIINRIDGIKVIGDK